MGRMSLVARFAVVLCACAWTGCGSKEKFAYDALDLAPPQEELSEFSLGEYRIPIPVAEKHGEKRLSYRNRFEFNFELYALVSPAEHLEIEDAWSRYQGKIRDQVIRICRNATIDELQEPELSTLKARLIDALASQMGKREVRQLLLTEVASQRL